MVLETYFKELHIGSESPTKELTVFYDEDDTIQHVVQGLIKEGCLGQRYKSYSGTILTDKTYNLYKTNLDGYVIYEYRKTFSGFPPADASGGGSGANNPPDCNLDWLDLNRNIDDLAADMVKTTLPANNKDAIFIPQSCIQDYTKLDSNPVTNLSNINKTCKGYKCSAAAKCNRGKCESSYGPLDKRTCGTDNDCQFCNLNDIAKAWKLAGMNPNICPFTLVIASGEASEIVHDSTNASNTVYTQGYHNHGLLQCDTCRQKEYNVEGKDCFSTLPTWIPTSVKEINRNFYIGPNCDIDITNNACIQMYSSVNNILAPFSIKDQFSSDKRTPTLPYINKIIAEGTYIYNTYGTIAGVTTASWCYPNQNADKFTDKAVINKVQHIGPFCQKGLVQKCSQWDGPKTSCSARSTWSASGGKWNGSPFPSYYTKKLDSDVTEAFKKAIQICKEAYNM